MSECVLNEHMIDNWLNYIFLVWIHNVSSNCIIDASFHPECNYCSIFFSFRFVFKQLFSLNLFYIFSLPFAYDWIISLSLNIVNDQATCNASPRNCFYVQSHHHTACQLQWNNVLLLFFLFFFFSYLSLLLLCWYCVELILGIFIAYYRIAGWLNE